MQALALASSQSWLLRLLREIFTQQTQAPAIGMLGRSSGNHDWLLANACVSSGFRLRNARNARNASDCV